MRELEQTMMPDPWVPLGAHLEANSFGSVTAFLAGTIVASNNVALYCPVIFPADCTLYALRFMAANGTGNYDIGLYNSSFARLASSGAVAMSAAGLKTLSLSDIRVTAGDLYYMAIALSSSSGQVQRSVSSVNSLIPAGVAQQASAMPLPNPMVPATMGGTSFPLMAFGIR